MKMKRKGIPSRQKKLSTRCRWNVRRWFYIFRSTYCFHTMYFSMMKIFQTLRVSEGDAIEFISNEKMYCIYEKEAPSKWILSKATIVSVLWFYLGMLSTLLLIRELNCKYLSVSVSSFKNPISHLHLKLRL